MSPMIARKRRLDIASAATLFITVILFVIALFVNGFTHDLLLEAGVFLVSVKLILASRHTELMAETQNEKLDEILNELRRRS